MSVTPSNHTAPLLRHSVPAVSSQSPAKRFWKAFAIALLIHVALLSLARSIIDLASGSIHIQPRDGDILESIGSLNWTTYQARPRWAPSFPESAETSFMLPVSSEALYFISRGSYQNGKVEMKRSTGGQGDDVRVDVRVAYHDERALARAIVHRLWRSRNRHGVGIYTPMLAWSSPRDRLYFEVLLTFPAASSDRSPLRIKELTTNTENFAYEIGDLSQSLVFENMELNTSNAPIYAKSVTLTRGLLTSSNGAIVGHFSTSDALVLHTSNARIETTTSLSNTGSDVTKLEMQTSNGPITSSVSLVNQGGMFSVISHTSNGDLTLHYDHASSGTRLVSDARASNGKAFVVMHPTFEGTYEVSTTNGQPVVMDTKPTDPLRRGRRRVVSQTTGKGVVAGRAYWVGSGWVGPHWRRGAESSSTVHTSNGRASLYL